MIKRIAIVATCAALAACKPATKEADATFDNSIPLREVMGHVVDPAVWALWNRAGDVIDASGTHSRVPVDPKTIPDTPGLEDDYKRQALEEEWTQAENGTKQLIMVTNILRNPAYVRKVENNDNGDWNKFVDRLNKAAHNADDAVEARNGDKMFETGGVIYQVCTDCHEKYLLPFVDPKTGEIPEGLDEKGQPVEKK